MYRLQKTVLSVPKYEWWDFFVRKFGDNGDDGENGEGMIFNPKHKIIKVIAAIVCVCFVWQDAGFASDFLRQRQFYETGRPPSSANSAGDIKRLLKEYFLMSKGRLSGQIAQNPSIKTSLANIMLGIIDDTLKNVTPKIMSAYNTAMPFNIETAILDGIIEKGRKKTLLNKQPFFLAMHLVVNYFMLPSGEGRQKLIFIIDEFLRQDKQRFGFLLARGICLIFEDKYEDAEITLKEAYNLSEKGLSDNEKELLPTLYLYLACTLLYRRLMAEAGGNDMPDQNETGVELLWDILDKFNPDKKNLYLNVSPLVIFTMASYVFMQSGQSERAFAILHKIIPKENEMNDYAQSCPYFLCMLSTFVEYSYKNLDAYGKPWAEGKFNEWKADADWLLYWLKLNAKNLESDTDLNNGLGPKIDAALLASLYDFLAVFLSDYFYIFAEAIKRLSQRREALSVEGLIWLSSLYISLGCLDRAGETLLMADLKDEGPASSEDISYLRKEIKIRKAGEGAAKEKRAISVGEITKEELEELFGLYERYERLSGENRTEHIIEELTTYLEAKGLKRVYVPLWLILFKSLWKMQRLAEARAIFLKISAFYPDDPGLIEIGQRLEAELEAESEKESAPLPAPYSAAKEIKAKKKRPKYGLPEAFGESVKPKKEDFDKRWDGFRKEAVSGGIRIDEIFKGLAGQNQLEPLMIDFLRLSLKWKGLQAGAVLAQEKGGHSPIDINSLSRIAPNGLRDILFSRDAALVRIDGKQCLPTEELVRFIRLIKKHFPEYDRYSQGNSLSTAAAAIGVPRIVAIAGLVFLNLCIISISHPVVLPPLLLLDVFAVTAILKRAAMHRKPALSKRGQRRLTQGAERAKKLFEELKTYKNNIAGILVAALLPFSQTAGLPAGPPVLTPDRQGHPQLVIPQPSYAAPILNQPDAKNSLWPQLRDTGVPLKTIKEILQKSRKREPAYIRAAKRWIRKNLGIITLKEKNIKVILVKNLSGPFLILREEGLIIIDEGHISKNKKLMRANLRFILACATVHFQVNILPVKDEIAALSIAIKAATMFGYNRDFISYLQKLHAGFSLLSSTMVVFTKEAGVEEKDIYWTEAHIDGGDALITLQAKDSFWLATVCISGKDYGKFTIEKIIAEKSRQDTGIAAAAGHYKLAQVSELKVGDAVVKELANGEKYYGEVSNVYPGGAVLVKEAGSDNNIAISDDMAERRKWVIYKQMSEMDVALEYAALAAADALEINDITAIGKMRVLIVTNSNSVIADLVKDLLEGDFKQENITVIMDPEFTELDIERLVNENRSKYHVVIGNASGADNFIITGIGAPVQTLPASAIGDGSFKDAVLEVCA